MFFFVSSILLLGITAFLALYFSWWWCCLLILVLPYVLVGVYDLAQTSSNVWRNFPVVGHVKQLFIENRVLFQDWVLENEREVRPFDLIVRNMVYHRAEDAQQTAPFGTKYDYYQPGFEWVLHSINPSKPIEGDLRITVGGPSCKQPYSCSILNVSAMSYGSISQNATLALNGGAKLGNFATNTGEGGLTPYHLQNGGDIIFQFGTAYFGCRKENGDFDPEEFAKLAAHEQVKMIEIKISQGAKPGYGAVLPGKKVTEEVAKIRKIKPWVTIVSPAGHKEFSTPVELLQFVEKLRNLADGKPVGFKLCLGQPHEMVAICKAILQTGIMPDYIAIDGGEGGSGAAHYESINYVGMPLEDALPFVYNTLVGFGLKQHIKLFAAGKITNAFHVARYLALGADACYSARGMMFALGCVQALQCNKNTCPTGITTLDPKLTKGLVPENKKVKVYNFHRYTIAAVKDMLISMGIESTTQLRRSHFYRRADAGNAKTLQDIYPYLKEGSLLQQPYPEPYAQLMASTSANSFAPLGQ